MANIRDLAVGSVLTAPSPATTGTTLVLQAGQGADMPVTLPFFLLLFPTGAVPTKYNSEKVLVTARSTDTLTIVRAQGETTAKSVAAGWIVANAIFADDLTGGAIKRNQTPTGLINSSNTTYTVNDIYTAGTLEVYLNGQRLRPGASEDYVETSGGFTMNYAPATGDVLAVDYLVTSTTGVTTTTSFVTGETPVGTINGTNLAFTVNSPFSPNSLEVFLDGVRQTRTTDFTENGPAGTFTFVTSNAPLTGSILRVNYMISGAYLISGSNSLVTGEVPSGTKNGSNALFTVLSGSYVANSLEVKLNGVDLQRAVDFVETSPTAGTFTMQTGYIPASTDIVTVSYQLSITTTGNADTVDGYHASATATANTLLPLNSAGKIPMTVVSNPYRFSAYRNAAQALVATSETKIVFDVEDFDPNSNFASGTYTAPLTGCYFFNANIVVSGITPTRLFLHLYKNGAQAKRGVDAASSVQGVSIAAFLQLTAGDTIDVYYWSSTSGGGLSGGASTYFSGFLVSQT